MHTPHTFILLLVLVFSIDPASGSKSELEALIEIKSSLDPKNVYLSSWTVDGDPCTFVGVACNEHHKVVNISLQGKGLVGQLPAAMVELRELSGLYLHYNALHGEIPKEIANLTELTDLYLNVNNFSGVIPRELGRMSNLQVLELSYNQLTGAIPPSLANLNKLTVLTLQDNNLSGLIPDRLAAIPSLKILDLRSNDLSGVVSIGFLRLKQGFQYGNNSDLCGLGFPSLRPCSRWDTGDFATQNTYNSMNPKPIVPKPVDFKNHPSKKPSLKYLWLWIFLGSILSVIAGIVIVIILLLVARSARPIELEVECILNSPKESYKESYSFLEAAQDSTSLQEYKFNLEDVISATGHFSERNLLGKSKFAAVYKGIMRDRSMVAIKIVNESSCKSEENELINGLSLLLSLKNENVMKLRGFCCSKDRGECFFIYEFASRGSLCSYLDDGFKKNEVVLDWRTRVSVIKGIAKGIDYLHREEPEKPCIIHKNISVEKVVLDQNWNPLILDSGFLGILADDVVYSAIKVSAGLGYMAPEYITTGRFTEKSDVYAFGVIVLQVISGRKILTMSTRAAMEAGKWKDLIDSSRVSGFSKSQASWLVKIALDCTNDLPENRPAMSAVVEELNAIEGSR